MHIYFTNHDCAYFKTRTPLLSNWPVVVINQQQQQSQVNHKSNKHIHNSQLSQQTEPLALYHLKTFETSKYSRVEVQIIRGESNLTRI